MALTAKEHHVTNAKTPDNATNGKHSIGDNGLSPYCNCIFEQPWWLDALAPGKWRAAEVKRGDEVVARMPYTISKKLGMTMLYKPKLTQTLGPWLRPSTRKYANRLGEEKEAVEALIKQLPAAEITRIVCHPSFSNMLPFFWAGFELSVKYTYRIPDISDLDAVWDGFSSTNRRNIRKAEKLVEVREGLGIDRFLDVHEMTFRRQGRKPTCSRELVKRLDAALEERGRRKILFGVDAQENIHSVLYTCWDDQTVYYLMGGGDPKLRNSMAGSLLMWRAIQHAATVGSVFDFEGSMMEPVERFFRGFGGIQTPFYYATRMPSWLGFADLWQRRRGRAK